MWEAEPGSSDACVKGRPGRAGQGQTFILTEERKTQRIEQNYDRMDVYDCFTLLLEFFYRFYGITSLVVCGRGWTVFIFILFSLFVQGQCTLINISVHVPVLAI